ncbi:MAG: lycopene cyclase domain-containing protein [Flavobacteriales bacterium]|nr:lycopene cyclase domain-containing protein [Flavobacteriales bacterium]
MDSRYTYFVLDLASIFFPLILSFDKKVHFYTRWKFLFPALFFNAVIFIAWDEFFTRMGIWYFNPDYLLGYYIGSLPIEEWLFFLAIPYACIFIYDCLKAYFPDFLQSVARRITYLAIPLFFILGFIYIQHWYTAVTFLLLAIILLFHILIYKTRFLGYFYLMWLIHLVPFFIINGYLTSLPVVIYNNAENMGIRIGTIPFEDAFYSMLKLIIIVSLYEGLQLYKNKKFVNSHKN